MDGNDAPDNLSAEKSTAALSDPAAILPGDKVINILLLGESGVGKSTFINCFANYLHFKDFDKAETSKEGIQVTIPATVTVVDENYKPITCRVGEDENETQEVGASATQDIKTYVFPMPDGKTKVHLLDSPGIGDVRGVKQDDENCEKILAHLATLEELHAFCILLKPNESRVTVLFDYCLKQILSRLEKSASRNLIFAFTNTRGTSYKPGETLPVLIKLVEEIKKRPPYAEIPLGAKNIFCFDNDCFRYLVAVQTVGTSFYKSNERLSYLDSWSKSSDECWRMMSYILGDTKNAPLPPHQLKNTLSVNKARTLIEYLTKPLADIAQLIADNIQALDSHTKTLQTGNQDVEKLTKNLYVPIIDLDIQELTEPVTVCTSRKCAELVKVLNVEKWHYTKRCHDPCSLTNVPREIVGDPLLLGCWAMASGKFCHRCGCSYLNHMHVYYISKTVDAKVVDENIAKNISDKKKLLEEVKNKVDEIAQRKDELEGEYEITIQTTAKFAHFLKNNAIVPINDAYKSYLNYLITREERLGDDKNTETITNLKSLLSRYEAAQLAFDRSLKYGDEKSVVTDQVSADSIMDSIDVLFSLKHNGPRIRELYNKQKFARAHEFNESKNYVVANYSSPGKNGIMSKMRKTVSSFNWF